MLEKQWLKWILAPLSAALPLARGTEGGARVRVSVAIPPQAPSPCSPTVFGSAAHPGCGSPAAGHAMAGSPRGSELSGQRSPLLGLVLFSAQGLAHGKCMPGPSGRLLLPGRNKAARRDVNARCRDVKRLRDSWQQPSFQQSVYLYK